MRMVTELKDLLTLILFIFSVFERVFKEGLVWVNLSPVKISAKPFLIIFCLKLENQQILINMFMKSAF